MQTYLLISGFRRPFRTIDAKKFILEQSQLKDDKLLMMWMDRQKKFVCLIVDIIDSAKMIEKGLNSKVWPPQIGGMLKVEITNKQKLLNIMQTETQSIDLNQVLTDNQKQFLQEFLTLKQGINKQEIKHKHEGLNKQLSKEEIKDKLQQKLSKEQSNKQKKVITLEDLFKKTKTQPCLYFLPNLDEEIQIRKRKQLEEMKQNHHQIQRKRSRSR